MGNWQDNKAMTAVKPLQHKGKNWPSPRAHFIPQHCHNWLGTIAENNLFMEPCLAHINITSKEVSWKPQNFKMYPLLYTRGTHFFKEKAEGDKENACKKIYYKEVILTVIYGSNLIGRRRQGFWGCHQRFPDSLITQQQNSVVENLEGLVIICTYFGIAQWCFHFGGG